MSGKSAQRLHPRSEAWPGIALVFQGTPAPDYPKGAGPLLEAFEGVNLSVAYCYVREVPPPLLRKAKHIVAFGPRAESWVKYFVGPARGQASYFSSISYLATRAKMDYTKTVLETVIGAIGNE